MCIIAGKAAAKVDYMDLLRGKGEGKEGKRKGGKEGREVARREARVGRRTRRKLQFLRDFASIIGHLRDGGVGNNNSLITKRSEGNKL